MHEASLHEENSFLTLTYTDNNLPDDHSLNHEHFQKFMKRLRKRTGKKIAYYMCGEYGDNTSRPHYHACLFGEDFRSDRDLYSRSNGNNLYRSDLLDDLWKLGECKIGELTMQSASYVSRYVLEKQYNDNYEAVDKATGEVLERMPPYCRMSLNPAIGKRWVMQYHKEVYESERDKVFANGRMDRPPRYYDHIAENVLGVDLGRIRENRVTRSDRTAFNNTPERLAVRERVKLKQIEKIRRKK